MAFQSYQCILIHFLTEIIELIRLSVFYSLDFLDIGYVVSVCLLIEFPGKYKYHDICKMILISSVLDYLATCFSESL